MNKNFCACEMVTSGDPDAGQGVGVDFVLFDESLTLFVDVDASVLAVVDLVVTHDRIAVGSDLNARQRVAVDVVVLDKTPT